MVRSAAAWRPGCSVLYAVVKHCFGTVTGTASCVIDDTSRLCISLRQRLTGRMYLFRAR